MTPYPRVDESAPCRHGDPERFFPASGANADAAEVKDECCRCPFADPCAAWAMQHENHGVWGGTTASERQDMRRRLRIRLETPSHLLIGPSRALVYRRRAS